SPAVPHLAFRCCGTLGLRGVRLQWDRRQGDSSDGPALWTGTGVLLVLVPWPTPEGGAGGVDCPPCPHRRGRGKPMNIEPSLLSRTGESMVIRLVEWFTTVVLAAVILVLAWMMVVAEWPESWRLASINVEVLLVLAILVTALLLVSLLALVDTAQVRRGP